MSNLNDMNQDFDYPEFDMDDGMADPMDDMDAFDPLDVLATHQGEMLDDILDADLDQSTHQGDALEDALDGSDALSGSAEPAGDAFQMSFDTDGDGIADTVLMDTDGNGVIDVMVHADQDGSITKLYDYNQDGEIDSGDYYTDLDQDGVFDMVVDILDTDHDGSADTAHVYMDLDGDMQPDFEAVTEIDPAALMLGQTGDTVIETESVMDFGADDDQVMLNQVMLNQVDDLEIDIASPLGLSQFSPEDADLDKVVGDPVESMEYWEYQGPTNRCAIYSQKFVIEELTGNDLDIEELSQIAEEQNWFSEEGGTSLLHTNKLLNYYGVDNTMSFDNTMSDIEECLANGGKVIVGVNADEIWYGEESNIFVPSGGANHALQVVGVDYTDPDNPQVILNDSGSPDGCGETVPMDVFVGAWEDGNCQMISCYA